MGSDEEEIKRLREFNKREYRKAGERVEYQGRGCAVVVLTLGLAAAVLVDIVKGVAGL